jgi:hypothetical protein
MSRPLWTTCVDWMVNNFKLMREVSDESNKYIKSSVSNVGDNGPYSACSIFDAICNCIPYCRDASVKHTSLRSPVLSTPEPNALGNFQCPKSGKLCSSTICGKYCQESISSTET